MIILVLLVIIALIYAFIEPFWLEVKEEILESPKVPKAFEKIKIIFLSDIHAGTLVSRKRVRKVVDTVNALHPDIILLGGDYVDADENRIEPCFAELQRLQATIGKFGVLGNHDYYTNASLIQKYMKQAGIIDLDNNAQWIEHKGGKIKIGGIEDMWEGKSNIQPTIEDVKESDFVILLSHNPDYAETLQTSLIDLVLSGHTHGGQITFFSLWAPITYSRYGQKYRTGLVRQNNTQVLISNGVGVTLLPFRFFARPQVHVIHLVRQYILTKL